MDKPTDDGERAAKLMKEHFGSADSDSFDSILSAEQSSEIDRNKEECDDLPTVAPHVADGPGREVPPAAYDEHDELSKMAHNVADHFDAVARSQASHEDLTLRERNEKFWPQIQAITIMSNDQPNLPPVLIIDNDNIDGFMQIGGEGRVPRAAVTYSMVTSGHGYAFLPPFARFALDAVRIKEGERRFTAHPRIKHEPFCIIRTAPFWDIRENPYPRNIESVEGYFYHGFLWRQSWGTQWRRAVID